MSAKRVASRARDRRERADSQPGKIHDPYLGGGVPPCGAARSRPQRGVAVRAIAAVNDSHNPGAAGLSVSRMMYVQIAGVKPPKSAADKLCARENPDALTSTGMISVRYTT